MAYIKSKDIQLFPSAFRGQQEQEGVGTVYNPGSRLTTEYNLTSLASRMSSVHKSYVIEYNKSAPSKDILFSLNGYLFAIKMNGGNINYFDEFADSNEIWAKIKLVPISDNPDINNTIETKPVLRPLSEDSSVLLDIDDEFVGLELTSTKPDDSQFKVLKLFEKQNDTWFVPKSSYFRIFSEEVESNLTEGLSINDEFDVAKLTADKINNVFITPASDSATLTIHDGKTLTAENSIKLAGTDNAVLTLNKNLTVAGTHNIALETSGANRTLKVSGNDKELAGAGSVLTMGGNLTTEGAHTTKFITTDDTELTLPTTGTLATLDGLETLTQKTLTSPILTAPTLGVATATSINGLKIDTTTGTLDIANSKKLEVNDNITVGTNAITLASNKSLTMQYAGLTVGGLNKTGEITLTSNTADARTLTLTGSPSLSGITTTGSGTLALNKNLTINDANKTLAGAGTRLTIDNNLDIAGTTGQITLGTGNHTLTFETDANTTITLPTTGTLYGTKANSISSSELALSVSDETGSGSLVFATSPSLTTPSLGVATATTINGLTLAAQSTGFTITGGTVPKTLAISGTTSISAPVTIYKELTVGSKYTYTGAVTVRSAGSSATTITGPNNGEAKLIAGTYGSLATTSTTPAVSGMRMLISTGPNSAVWAVDMLKAGFMIDGSQYHSTINLKSLTLINGLYREKFSDSVFTFERLFNSSGLSDLSKCFGLTSLTFVVPYSTSPNAISGDTTTIVVPFTLGTASSGQTTNYTAVANDSGSTPGVASKIEISADGICTIYVAVVKNALSQFGVDGTKLRFTGSVIQITE